MFLLTEREAQTISDCVDAVSNVAGDIVEIGVFEGGSAELICQKKEKKTLHLFDTWEGIVATAEEDLKTHSKFNIGRYSAKLEPVKEKLSQYSNVKFYKGEFPKTYENNIDKISLLHIDVDLYKPTKDAIRLLWNKLQIGGIMILHDYPSFEGVRMAVDEELVNKQFIKIPITKEQTIIIKYGKS